MTIKEVFNQVVRDIKNEEFYVPRGYQTIGGMWTVDTWLKDNLRVQVMDEGYTTVLSLMENEKVIWSATDSVNKFELTGIKEDEFINLFPTPRNKIKPR